MTWVRFEDRFPWHRKIRPLSDGAFRLHVSGICWSTEHLTDGYIPTTDLHLVSDVRNPARAVRELEDRGIWDEDTDGWKIHDYLTYNLPAERVLAERAAAAERQRRAREAAKSRRESQGESRRDSQPGNAVVTVPPTRPDPSNQKTSSSGTRKRATTVPDIFPITDAMKAWGREHAPSVADPQAETRQFLDFHRAKGSTFKDWTAAWRTWMSNAQKYATQGRGAGSSPRREFAPKDAWLENM